MNVLLLVAGIILIIGGLVGCIIPVIPGPPFSYAGLLAIHFSDYAEYSMTLLIVLAVVAVLVTVLDYVVPAIGTKTFGGTKRGVVGAGVGLVIGLFFFPPLGLVIGPFIGALVGELTGSGDMKKALKSSFGSLLGILTGTAMKLAASGVMTFYFVKALV